MKPVLEFAWHPALEHLGELTTAIVVVELEEFAVEIGHGRKGHLTNPIVTWLVPPEELTLDERRRLGNLVSGYVNDIRKGGLVGMTSVLFEVAG